MTSQHRDRLLQTADVGRAVRTGSIALLATLGAATASHEAAAQVGALQERLAAAERLDCRFSALAAGSWEDGAARTTAAPADLEIAFSAINADEGTAEAQGDYGASFIVVRYANDYLHLMQSFAAGPLYVTTVLAKETSDGRMMAVHTRHEYADITLPGFTSAPEMYVGDCAVGGPSDA